jgi:hypothetical protein
MMDPVTDDQSPRGGDRGRSGGRREDQGGSGRSRQPSHGGGGRPPRQGSRSRPGSEPARRERDPGAFDNSERRGGARLAPKTPRLPDPAIPEEVTGKELDRGVHQQLRTLSKENADGVAKHLVMVAALLEADDLDGALAHAETAARRAGRVPAAREALGLVAYHRGDYARALSEFRTVKRLSGSKHLLPLMVDCERGLGRLDRALDLASSPEVGSLDIEDRVELAIVVSGIRRDRGQLDAAEVALQIPAARLARHQPWAARLLYARAEVALARGQRDEARALFAETVDVDQDLVTDAGDRLDELDGVTVQWEE